VKIKCHSTKNFGDKTVDDITHHLKCSHSRRTMLNIKWRFDVTFSSTFLMLVSEKLAGIFVGIISSEH
jgi:hypothetical protein